VRTQALFRDRFVGVVRLGHSLCRGKITPARYAGGRHVFVSRRGLAEGPIDEALKPFGLEREIVTIVGGFAAALALARLGSHRRRTRAAYRQAARRNAQLSASGPRAGDHHLHAMAPAARRRSGASLAARAC
jgi:hypothetical protein